LKELIAQFNAELIVDSFEFLAVKVLELHLWRLWLFLLKGQYARIVRQIACKAVIHRGHLFPIPSILLRLADEHIIFAASGAVAYSGASAPHLARVLWPAEVLRVAARWAFATFDFGRVHGMIDWRGVLKP